MGIVYQGQDTKLDRLVALKFLPHHLTANETERARFIQEAKAASALNHPNVCIIHYIEEYEGAQFIVMEFVEGATLREKFRAAPLKLNDALAYAVQIGEALQEAHNKGIVHRDVKADNIMVNTKNQIKVMDFGLAKLKGSLKLTRTSSTVGTLAYMAPEQIQGEEVDGRSDIFSFGVVLYEMLTQHTPFRGEHEAAMMYSIVNEEPEPIEKYRPELSPEYMRIIKRSLEKDPEDRYQSVADMVSELRRLRKETTRVTRSSPSIPVKAKVFEAAEPAEVRQKSKKGLWITLAILLPLLGGAAYMFIPKYLQRLEPAARGERDITVNPNMTFQVLQIPFTEISCPGLSPDGNWVSFPAVDANNKWDVWYMNTSGSEPRRITSESSENISEADISPDGGKIAYDRWNPGTQQFEVCVVSALGGVSKKIAGPGMRPLWRPDGQRIGYIVPAASSNDRAGKLEFQSVRPDGGDPRIELEESAFSGVAPPSFSWSPGGKSIALVRTFFEGYQEVFLVDLESAKKSQLTMDQKSIGDVCWTRDDNIVFSSGKGGNANLWMIPSRGGTAVQVTKGSGPDISMKMSADGKKLLYLQQQRVGHLWIADSGGNGARQISFGDHDVRSAAISPDGKQIAVLMYDSDPLKPASHIYVADHDGSNPRPLTSGNEIAGEPRWSPDGKWIAYCSRSTSEPVDSERAYLVQPSISGSPKRIGWCREVWWLDSTDLILHQGTNSWITSISGGEMRPFHEDSTLAVPILGGDYILFSDLHPGREGWWVCSSPRHDSVQAILDSRPFIGPRLPHDPADSEGSIQGSQKNKTRYLFSGLKQFALGPGGSYLLYVNDAGELRKKSLPDGIEQVLPSPIAGRQVSLGVSPDGREIVYVDSRLSSKLVMIENLR
jgi:serine/threonine protein kinase